MSAVHDHTPEMDWCSRVGAVILKQRIEDYWAKRGFKVDVELKRQSFTRLIGRQEATRVDVRSNMRNGLPTEHAP